MRRLPASFVLLWGVAALAQQPATDPALQPQAGQPSPLSPPVVKPATDEPEDRIRKDERERPPTPLEERANQIRRFDPIGSDEDADKRAAEKEKEKEERETQKRRDRTPLPGSVAAAEARDAANASGPRVVGPDDADAQPPEYTGPAVLSHDYTINGFAIPEDLQWRTFANVAALYTTGINAATTGNVTAASGSLGPIQNASSFGLNFSWGISGRHMFHRDSIGIMYTGNRPWYREGDQYTGMNTRFSFDYSHVVSRSLTLKLTETGSMFSQSYALQNPLPTPDTSNADIADLNLSASTIPAVFDGGAKSFSTGLSATWQQSFRLSYTAATSYFFTLYDGSGLIGVTGEQARGTVNYRLSNTTTTGIFYSFSSYTYPNGTGTSDSHSLGALFSYAVNRSTTVRVRAGGAYTEIRALEAVPLNPLLASLFGLSSELIEGSSKSTTEDISASLMRDFGHRATTAVSYAKGISPGNGLYLTSIAETLSVSTSLKLTQRLPITVSAGRSSVSSAGVTAGSYVTEYVHVGSSRILNQSMSMNVGVDYRHFQVGLAPGLTNEFSVTCGFSWNHTGEKLWPPW